VQGISARRARTRLSNIANILAIQGDYEGALKALSQAFEVAKTSRGLSH